MTNLMRWEPMRDMITLREAMDRLFDEAFTRPLSLMNVSLPTIDMYQTDDEVVVEVAVPGLKPDEVQLTITGDTLTIRGEYKAEQEDKNRTYHIRERQYGAFERSILLPTEVNADKAKAEFENGMLTITLPKAEEVRPKTITVKAK